MVCSSLIEHHLTFSWQSALSAEVAWRIKKIDSKKITSELHQPAGRSVWSFFTVIFILLYFFISFSLLLVVKEWSYTDNFLPPLSTVHVYQNSVLWRLTVWGINARLQLCVPLHAGVQDLLHPELHCHRVTSPHQESWATVMLWTALLDCFLRLSWAAKYEISQSDLLEWAGDVPQRT